VQGYSRSSSTTVTNNNNYMEQTIWDIKATTTVYSRREAETAKEAEQLFRKSWKEEGLMVSADSFQCTVSPVSPYNTEERVRVALNEVAEVWGFNITDIAISKK
jgi:hypothetical protein